MRNKLILGLNLSHDSSAALLDDTGKVFGAIAEERLSRKKNHWGIPVRSIESLISGHEVSIERVIIGSDKFLTRRHANSLISSSNQGPSSGYGSLVPQVPPGKKSELISNVFSSVNSRILELIRSSDSDSNPDFTWVRHHNSHIGCALGVQNMREQSLLVSLDGMGDGESGLICLTHSGSYPKVLHSISSLDSLGKLYSSVTKRYNFSPERHEGKITGLAAYGNYSKATELLLDYVQIKNGVLSIKYLKGFKNILATRLFPDVSNRFRLRTSIQDIVDLAEEGSNNYADLAYAVQYVLEETVLEILRFWKNKTQQNTLGLSGGVFANVRLNQRIAEEQGWESVRIFPNMGDGGIAVGGAWFEIAKKGNLSNTDQLFENMYLAPESNREGSFTLDGLLVEVLDENIVAKRVAELLSSGNLVGVHQGKMEFGPRALGARSILIDPRNQSINEEVNRRLRRTEFMPFAPMIKIDKAHEVCDLSKVKDWFPFHFMTMTVSVREQYRHRIPAVVHVDGTARPQFVSPEQVLPYRILHEFELLTSIPVLVNTSFNVHEEPINNTLDNSLDALRRGAVDYVLAEGKLYSLTKNNKTH